jgi:hypothetical protein
MYRQPRSLDWPHVVATLSVLFLASLAINCAPVWCVAQEPEKPAILADKSQVDRHEILRRGANVSIAGEGLRDSADLLYSMAMSPPADDSDQWQVTLFGPSNESGDAGAVRSLSKGPCAGLLCRCPANRRQASLGAFQLVPD